MIQLLYLDIDGVLNRHERHSNGYSGMHPYPVGLLNQMLEDLPDVQLVISSAWRYQVISGHMTMKGFECMLLTHGLECFGRIHSVTGSDEAHAIEGQYTGKTTGAEFWEWLKVHGCEVRAQQITKHLAEVHANAIVPVSFAVVDDLAVPVQRLVKTDPSVGLDCQHVQQLQKWLNKPVAAKESAAWA